MRLPAPAVMATLGVLTAALVAAPAGGAAVTTVLTTSDDIGAISMDGGRVAVEAVGNRTTCGDITRVVRIHPRTVMRAGCDPGQGSELFHPDGPALALGGTTVLLAAADFGNFVYPIVYQGSVVSGRFTIVDDSLSDGADYDIGPFVGPVVASGAQRFYGSYHRDWLPAGCDPFDETCHVSAPIGGVVRASDHHMIWQGAGAVIPMHMEGNRIALRDTEGAVRVIDTAGGVHADVPAAHATDAATVGTVLAVLRGHAIDVRNAETGALIRTVPLPAAAYLPVIDVAVAHGHSWAVVATEKRVIAVRLADGRRTTLARYVKATVFSPQVEREGVVWGYRGAADSGSAQVVAYAPLPAS